MGKKQGNDKILLFFITLIIKLFVLLAKCVWWLISKSWETITDNTGNKAVSTRKNKRGINQNAISNPAAMIFKNNARIALESIYIIQTTLNWDILKSRIEINENSIIELQKYASQHDAILYFSEVVDSYKVNYYDKPITDKQIQIILEPSREIRYSFYADSIYYSFNKYLDNQNRQIDALKTAKGKENRMAKIKEIAIYYYNLMNTFGINTPNYSYYCIEIQKHT